MTDAHDAVRVEHDGSIAHLFLVRPDRANALAADLLTELRDAVTAQAAVGTRAAVLSGAGDRFSAGADLDQLSGEESDIEFDEAVAEVGRALAAAPFPTIAAIEGYAFGAAVDLAWSCDAVVVARDARLRVPATELGLLYNPDALIALHARVGDRAWRRLILMGDELDGDTAYSLGMGEVLAEPGQAVDRALLLAASAISGTPGAVAATKAFARAIIDRRAHDPEWQQLRRELLSGAERRSALRDGRRRLGR